jgi:hypothetical protein
MVRALLTTVVVAAFAAVAAAVEPGDAEKDVLATLGKPNAIRQTANGAVWKFKDGTSLRIEGGVVREIDGPGAAKPLVRVATTEPTATVEPPSTPPPAATKPARTAPAVNVPKPVTARQSSPASVPADPTPNPAALPRVQPVRINPGPAATRLATQPPAAPVSKPKRYSGFFFLAASGLVLLGCKVMLLVVAFKEGAGWGLACLFVPFAALIFIVTHWADTKKILAVQLLAGMPLLVLAAVLLA